MLAPLWSFLSPPPESPPPATGWLLKLPHTPPSFQGPLLRLTAPLERSLTPSCCSFAYTHASRGPCPFSVPPATPPKASRAQADQAAEVLCPAAPPVPSLSPLGEPKDSCVCVGVPSQTEEVFRGRDQQISKMAPMIHTSRRTYPCILSVSWT